jgi:benzoyl-CoA reductase/2-hydroxyglutaryl-CoA dehydratase subunit BcrC/BadD/HgdB
LIENILSFIVITLIASIAGLGMGWFFLVVVERSERNGDNNDAEENHALKDLVSEARESGRGAEVAARSQIESALGELSRQRNRPARMSYYDGVASLQGKRVSEIGRFKKGGGKVVGYFCLFVPIELIRASGALPLRLDSGLYCTVSPSEQLLPGDACPVVKSTLGMGILGVSEYFRLCDVLVCPSSCDMKTKKADFLENLVPVWRVEVPRYRDEPWIQHAWQNEVDSLRSRLETLTGHKVTRNSLRRAIELAQDSRAIFHRLHELRRHRPSLISGRDAMMVTQVTWYDDLERWAMKTGELCGELEQRIDSKVAVAEPEAPRIMLAGSPIIWPNWKLPNLIEGSGAVIVCDELCTGDQGGLSDSVNVNEWTMKGMLAGIADRYLLPVTCPFFTPNDKRIDKIVRMVRDFAVDGVVYHQLRGCYVHKIEFSRIRAALKDLGIPVLGIETDYTHEDLGQLRTRIEAFLEMIQSARIIQ